MPAQFSVPRRTPQQAAAVFVNKHVENSRELFVRLGQELGVLPDLAADEFRLCRVKATLPCKLLGAPRDHALFREKFGTELPLAVATAVQVWVHEALRDSTGRLPDATVEVMPGAGTLELAVAVPLF